MTFNVNIFIILAIPLLEIYLRKYISAQKYVKNEWQPKCPWMWLAKLYPFYRSYAAMKRKGIDLFVPTWKEVHDIVD